MNANDRPVEPSSYQRRFSRRGFLGGAAALSAGAMVGSRLPGVAHAAEAGDGLHGVELRGMYLTSKDRLAEGRFGTMFKRLPAFAPRDDLLDGLARTMVEDQTTPDDDKLNTSPRLFAGFTFIAQFIDHDITFDNTPLELQQADPDARVNFRTPRYDLDAVYGRGPASEPQFYDPADPAKLLVTPNVNGVEDVARDSTGRAIIPEPRNDENLIIVQLHKAVAGFHNRIVDHARAQGIRPEWVFETARRLTRWHYQWAVIHDFLPRFVGDELIGTNGTV
jgi:Animal haem peroxidase